MTAPISPSYQGWYRDRENATLDIYFGNGAAPSEVARINATTFGLGVTLQPYTSDGAALGTGSLMWSDLFLASGGVINFNNGDVTITHSSNLLTIGGGTITITAGDLTLTDGNLDMGDDDYILMGTGDDIAIAHRSTTLNANTALTSVLVGTPVVTAVPANSVIISSVSTGDIVIAVDRADAGNSQEVFRIDNSAGLVVFNEGSSDWDFRIEGDSVSSLFHIDAGADSIGIGVAPNANGALLGIGAARTFSTHPGTTGGFISTAYNVNITDGATAQDATAARYRHIALGEPTLIATNSGVTTTTASTVFIQGAPTAGNNMTITTSHALFIDAGSVRLDGSLYVESSPTEGTSGEQLTSGGSGAVMTWAAAGSLREYKDFLPSALEPQTALDRILGTQVYRFHYKEGKGTGDLGTEYLGVVADEAPWAMHYDGAILNPVNTFGYTVLAFQALSAEIKELKAQVAKLEVMAK